MKFTITIEVPEGSLLNVNSDEGRTIHATITEPHYVPPFEDQLIPLPPEAIPVPGDPVPFRGMAQNVPQGTQCPIHHEPWKLVPAGVSTRTAKPYEAFRTCPVRGCDQRPR